uniref:BPTI/Kunitz inhibitor domain-containing protein n=1 Tax=Mesocestoides corti TaxID=53468 RepID=A0A5K3FEV1_MESCO
MRKITLLVLVAICLACFIKAELIRLQICRLPIVVGPCIALMKLWGFDISKHGCFLFSRGGCSGNAKRLNKKVACTLICRPCRRRVRRS